MNANQKPKKRGPPFGHRGTSRKRPDRADTTIVLKLEECPYCGGKLKELKEVRVRYEEEIKGSSAISHEQEPGEESGDKSSR